MAAKEVIVGEQSRQTILHGINVLADAVKVTLVRRGATLLLRKSLARQ
jgi:chaperonin GroEL